MNLSNQELEGYALIFEGCGMAAKNEKAKEQGKGIVYDAEEFFKIAERLRSLKNGESQQGKHRKRGRKEDGIN